MPKKKNSPPPPVMTWGRASLFLVLAVIFDIARIFFTFLWFFAPAAAALYCESKVGSVWVIGGLLAKGCTAGAVAIGIGGSSAIIVLGAVLAMATGLLGWLVVGFFIVVFNSRVLKENALWFASSLVVSQIPFIGAIPMISVAVWKMHSRQIRVEREAYKNWEKETAAARLQERNQQQTEFMQVQANKLATADVY